jgi:hydrogenase maturation protease
VTADQPGLAQQRTLVIGYGNPDRQDDGVASHILDRLSHHLERPVHFSVEDLPESGEGGDLILQLQLTPEIVEGFLAYNQIIFVDAHTGEDELDIHIKEVSSNYQASPLTHHMTPETCMALLSRLYQKSARGVLVSIRGYEFGFTRSLSPKTLQAVDRAAEVITQLISESSPSTR